MYYWDSWKHNILHGMNKNGTPHGSFIYWIIDYLLSVYKEAYCALDDSILK